MKNLLLAIFYLPTVLCAQSVSATYENGDIPTNLGVFSDTCNGPLTTLTVSLPAGGPYLVTGIDINYNMTAQGGGFKSHQRSQIRCQNNGVTESTVFEGTGNTGGVQSYSRTNVSIANGPYPGDNNLIFQMRAWRTSQGSDCNTTFNRVDNFTWMITVHYSVIPPDGSVGVGTTSPNSSALMDLRSVQKGLLLPTMTLELRNAIVNPAQGLLLYCTNCAPASIYQFRGSAWSPISSLTLEDVDGDTKIMVEKNQDEDKIRFDMGGTEYYVMNGPKLQINNSGRSVFIGENAGMADDLTFNDNVFIGYQAGQNSSYGIENVAIGSDAFSINQTGFFNTVVGRYANVSIFDLYNATALGYNTIVNSNDKIRLGHSSVTVIEGQVDWSFPSDARFKYNVEDEHIPGLSFIQKLRPVTYQFDTRKYDEHIMQNFPDSIRQENLALNANASSQKLHTGFLAQEVEQVCKDLNYSFSGLHVPENETDNYSLAYGSFVPLLVKAMQEQQILIDELKEQNKQLAEQYAELKDTISSIRDQKTVK